MWSRELTADSCSFVGEEVRKIVSSYGGGGWWWRWTEERVECLEKYSCVGGAVDLVVEV